jgi:hypothetical protein
MMPHAGSLPIENAQRIAVLETKLAAFEKTQASMDAKLDELLALRNKGAGAFWLATSLAGAGAVSIFFQIIHWFGGH